MKEIWKDIPGYEGRYQVSSLGRVKSMTYRGSSGEKVLKPYKDFKGYYRVILCTHKAKSKHCHQIGRLVLEAFCGPCPVGYEAAHLNGSPSDNRVNNLRWVTPTENNRHKEAHGTKLQGSTHPMAKLNERTVMDIRRKSRIYNKKLAEEFGLDMSTLGKILKRKTWKHI